MVEASVGHQCPECVRAGRRDQRPARTAFGGGRAGEQGHVTKALIGLNVAVALLALVSAGNSGALGGGGLGGLLGSSTPLHLWGAIVVQPTQFTDAEGQIVATVDGIAGGEYHRLFTSMFLHFGLIHLLMNMWALWVLGRTLEAALGPARYLALYLLSGLGGSVAVYLFAPGSLTAGASGAIFGMFAALFVVLRRLKRDTSSVVPILVINLVITFAVPGISIAGHLGGMVTGAILGAGLAYAPKSVRTPVQIAVLAGVALLLIVITAGRTVMLTG